MRVLSKILILLALIFPCTTIGQDTAKLYFGENTSKSAIMKALKKEHRIFLNGPITNEESAIALAEPLLFKVYSKKLITSEKPYHVYLKKLHWYIYGNMPEGSYGGTFKIVINKETGEVIEIIHYQ